MSGLRKCAECDQLHRIESDGPEVMRPDGTFPRHVCNRCDYLKEVREGFSDLQGAMTEFSKTGAGPVVHVIMPHEGKESHVLAIRWKDKDRLVADVCEEESGKILHDDVIFTPGQEDVLEPLLDVL